MEFLWADDEAVFMINVITVPEAEADVYLERWDAITYYMRRQKGFIRNQPLPPVRQPGALGERRRV